jgi:hypothetical protein
MKKFDLAAARQQAAAKASAPTADIESGTHAVRITQVVDCDDVYNRFDDVWQPGVGLAFQLPDGRIFGKVFNPEAFGGHWSMVAAALPDTVDGLAAMLGQQLIVEVQANRAWPKLIAAYAADSMLAEMPASWPSTDLILLEADEQTGVVDLKANAVQIQKLHVELRKSLAARPPKKAAE